jgi:hypothetical protein
MNQCPISQSLGRNSLKAHVVVNREKTPDLNVLPSTPVEAQHK